MIADRYAAAIRDEIWIGGVRVESRLICGEAEHRGREIIATDRLRDLSLRDQCEEETARVRAIVREIDTRARIVVRATSDEGVRTSIVITIGGLSIVTTPQHAHEDISKLQTTVGTGFSLYKPSLPLVWHSGTAAILLHEIVGHAYEHNHAALTLPQWLDVRINYAMRRETFRDVPLLRMTEVEVAQHGAPFDLPAQRVDIHYVNGGSYEPLTQTVTIDVAVPRFSITATREQIARVIVGAGGDPVRYPGVICSREGQELYVPSRAPVVITEPLA